MKMEIYEFNVCTHEGEIAGFNNLEKACAYAFQISKSEHCGTDVINAFTGEVHKSYSCYVTVTYDMNSEQLEKIYTVKEGGW